MFDVDHYKHLLQTQWLGHEICYFKELPSTNSYLKRINGEKISHGMVCLADYQTKGRGQYERNWVSAPGQNLTFTIAFQPSNAERLHVLTLACARAVVELIESEINSCVIIKWPNDVLVDQKKISGLLTETVFSGNRLDRVLVGIGININQEHFGEDIKGRATSLKLEKGTELCCEQVLASYLQLVEYYHAFWQKNDIRLLRTINQKLVGYGKWIRLSVNGHSESERYKLLGINEGGQLTVINKESEVETFSYEQIRLITD